MLLFSTVLEMNPSFTREAFMNLLVKWNKESPHQENIIPDLVWDGKFSARYGDEKLWLAVEEYDKESTVAVRFEKRERDGIIWDTDFVMNFRNMKLSIRLDRTYVKDAPLVYSKFSSPHFIVSLIENGYIKNDGDIPVIREPIMINQNNADLIAGVVLGTKHYKYPIIYISKTYFNENPINADILANRLKGIAHVLVQEDHSMSGTIRQVCQSRNEYYGAIGIYYPNQLVKHKRYMYRRESGEDTILLNKVINEVLYYSNSQSVEPLFTWQGVNNAMLLDKLNTQVAARIVAENEKRVSQKQVNELQELFDDATQKMREQAYSEALDEANALIASVDEDMAKLRKQISDLTIQNEVLLQENQGLRNKLNNIDTIPVLTFGDEYDFYEGEIKDLVLSTLHDSLKGIPDRSRRKDVIKNIIKNNDYKHLSEDKAEDIKRLLKGYDRMSAKLKQDLESYGFEIKEDGKHYKVFYYGDSRYSEILSKTPSDWRTGKTAALKLIKIAY